MNITFYGAVREVTGSMHLVSTARDNILLDCGMFQGRRKESEEKNRTLPFDPRMVTNIVLSHAHIDHSGRIPLLTRKNFSGRIFCTRATADACEYLLLDSAHIQESDAQYLNYKSVRNLLHEMQTSPRTQKISAARAKKIKEMLKKNHHELDNEAIERLMDRYHLDRIRPLYSIVDAEQALKYFDGYPYRNPVAVGADTTATFYEAGHILGSAMTVLRVVSNGKTFTVGFSGDIGRFDKPILKDPCLNFAEIDRDLDLLIMEITYGNRIHEPVGDIKNTLKQVLTDTYNRGGCLLIPAFAFGRTQELVYVIHELYNEGAVPRIPVYVDSPLAIKLTRVFGEHPEVYDRETQKTFLENGQNPFQFKQVHFTSTVDESIALMREDKPHIVIASSGMCEAGRILHHLRYKIHSSKNSILIVGFMAENTLGRRLLEEGEAYEKAGRRGPAPLLKFLNKTYPLKAHVTKIGGFSAHADRDEMLAFLKRSNLRIGQIAVVHGEEQQSLSFADHLSANGYSVTVPRLGETLRIKKAFS